MCHTHLRHYCSGSLRHLRSARVIQAPLLPACDAERGGARAPPPPPGPAAAGDASSKVDTTEWPLPFKPTTSDPNLKQNCLEHEEHRREGTRPSPLGTLALAWLLGKNQPRRRARFHAGPKPPARASVPRLPWHDIAAPPGPRISAPPSQCLPWRPAPRRGRGGGAALTGFLKRTATALLPTGTRLSKPRAQARSAAKARPPPPCALARQARALRAARLHPPFITGPAAQSPARH